MMKKVYEFNEIQFENNAIFIEKVVYATAIVEKIVEDEMNKEFWIVEDKLDKRRNIYSFDWHLQNMLIYLSNLKLMNAYAIECGNKSLYRTEILLDNQYYFHIMHNFDRNSNYLKNYLGMNNENEYKYGYFKYSLDRNKITEFKLIFPKNDNEICINLISLIEQKRNYIKCTNYSISNYVKELSFSLIDINLS